jgi:hypothetical protein
MLNKSADRQQSIDMKESQHWSQQILYRIFRILTVSKSSPAKLKPKKEKQNLDG